MTTGSSSGEMPRITVEELRSLLAAGQSVAILDVRSPREYDWMHIAGAQRVSPEQLGELKLPSAAQVVTY